MLATQEFWLTVEGGRQVGAAKVLLRQGGRAAVAASVRVAVGVPWQVSRPRRSPLPHPEKKRLRWPALVLLSPEELSRIGPVRPLSLASVVRSASLRRGRVLTDQVMTERKSILADGSDGG